MAIGNINNGELGSSVRNKLNQLVNAINNQVVKLTGNQTISGEKYFTDNVGIGTTSPSEKLHISGADEYFASDAGIHRWGNNKTIGVRMGTKNVPEIDFRRWEGFNLVHTVGNISLQKPVNGIVYGLNFKVDRPSSNTEATTSAMFIERGGNVGIGTTSPSSRLEVNGSFSATSKNFKIDHPLPSKKDTHKLVHSSVEAPRADLIYSGMVQLVDGTATVNIDTASNMTEGTFEALVGNVRRFCTNEGGFTRVKSSIVGNLLTIEAEDPTCTDEIFWQVIGERKDAQIVESNSTDDNGKLIVEPEIIVEDDKI